MDPTDRRRLTFAIVLTVVALPALWVVSRDQAATSGAPTAGAVGIDAPVANGSTAAPTTTYRPQPPVFINAPAESDIPVLIPAVTVAAPVIDLAVMRASFRRFTDPSGRPCSTVLAPLGTTITVTDIDNGQSTTCRNTYGQVPSGIDIVLHTDVLALIADLTDAPVSVRLSW